MKIFRLFVAFALVCFPLSQSTRAVVPAPDGAYPNFTTAEGQKALQSLTIGAANTAVGAYSLFGTTTGSFNTAVGAGALDLNTGSANTAVGVAALLLNTGTNNTGVGVDALGLNTSGENNAAVGAFALYNNSTGRFNTAIGARTLVDNNADANTAVGHAALQSNASGTINTAIGVNALMNNTTGENNIALGTNAGSLLTTESDNIDIGNFGVAGDSHTIRIGTSTLATATTYIVGIGDAAVTGVPVVVNNSDQLGIVASSKRFKEEIRPMGEKSEAILALRPVRFRYKKEIDPVGTSQFGLVAEDVEKVNPDLVVRDKEGKPYSVRYDQVNAMLLNEFLKEHKTVQEQGATITALRTNDAKQEATIARLEKQVEALTAGLQKVSAQLELSKASPETVLNQ